MAWRGRQGAGGNHLRRSPIRGRLWSVIVRAVVGLVPAACAGEPSPAVVTPAAATVAGRDPRAVAARDRWVLGIDTLRLAVARLDSAAQAVDGSQTATESVQARFREARLAFKRIEFAAAYYEPSTTELINGPALPRVDDEEGPETVFPPEGFQVIEEQLFPAPDPADRATLVNEIRNLGELTTRLRTAAMVQGVTDDRVWDAAKLEIARVVTLGITGFDSPVALHSLPEAAEALRGTRVALGAFAATPPGGARAAEWEALDSAFTAAITALDTAASFDEFDRLGFIVAHANPLARALDRVRRGLALAPTRERRAFAMNAATLFDSNAFDPQAFAHPAADPDTPARAALGRQLFFEPRLSGGAARSCATCHDPARAFTDGRARSAPLAPAAVLRNAPTVINAGLQVGSFYDLRTTFLEDQVTDVVGSQNEMHGSVDATAERLAGDPAYSTAFAAAFGGTGDSAVTGARLRSAVAAYLRSLTALDSRADRALRGDTAALTAAERLGMNLFMGKGKCATCHFVPLFNGTVPPMYQETDVEVLGVPSRAVTRGARVDPDSGRFRVTRSAPHLHAFKTPTVRNIALTAPYMHNGVYRTLDDVVDFYDRGGGAGIGIELENQTLPPTPLDLTVDERRALVEFMQALTDTTGLTKR